jgi:hypothetical protein
MTAFLPKRRPNPADRDADYLPTPAEIRTACLRIQAGWDEVEEECRRTGSLSRASSVQEVVAGIRQRLSTVRSWDSAMEGK